MVRLEKQRFNTEAQRHEDTEKGANINSFFSAPLCLCASVLNLCFFVSVFFALSSCVLHSKYRPPAMEIPEHWRFGSDAESLDCVDINALWWEQFKDPVLTDLIHQALVYNQEIKTAICRVQEFKARLGIVRSKLWPQIYANASAFKQESSLAGIDAAAIPQDVSLSGSSIAAETTPTFKRITDIFSVYLNLTYEVDLWGKIYSATEASYAELLAQENVRRGVVLNIATSIARAYIVLRELDRELYIALETKKSYEESYRLAKLRLDEGLTSELEATQAQAQISLAEAQVVRAELFIGQQENLISILAGQVPNRVERGFGITDWPVPFEIPEGLPSDLLFQRPDILQAEQLIISANARIGVARADYFPALSLTALFGYESLELKNLFNNSSRTWQYGGSLLQPLFTGGYIINNVHQAKAIHCEMIYQYETIVLNAFKEVEDALIAHQKAKELFLVQKNRVNVLKQTLKIATIQYSNGQTDYLNVLDAERNLFDAELDMAKAQGGIFTSLVDIYKALGGGWVYEADCEALEAGPKPSKYIW